MKSRVAVPAALIALIALVLLPVYNSLNIAEDRNESIRDEMRSICHIAGEMTKDTDADKRWEVISSLNLQADISHGLYSSDGTPLYASDNSDIALNEVDVESATVEMVRTYRQVNTEGVPNIYAIYRFEDGAFLLLSAQEINIASILANRQGIIWILLLLTATVAVFIVVWMMIHSKERLVNRVMHTLDQFSDGNFDVRIDPLPGRDATVAEYNAIIARIQSRIFQQRSRNHALSVVMTQIQNGIIAVDQDLRVILLTPVAKKLLGIVGSAEGMPVSEASKDVKLDEVFNEAMQQCGVYTNDVAARTTVGRGHRPLRLYVSPMRNDGKVVGALAMVEDITELRRLEQVRTDFAANVSHELKTPLTSIRGFVETLQAGAIDNPPMAHKFLRIIMLETERLTRLINDILSISKLESGDTEVATERLRLDKMAYDVCDMLDIHAGEKKVTINYHMNEKPTFIMGNPDRVEQMLINLVENAIKYNKEGGSVTVQVFSNANEANITISDTGIGIAEEHLPRMFERFYRVDKGRSRQMGGTGLGLAIVKHIVRSMNGEIEVHSKLGEGTEFLITLPLAPAESPDKDTIFDDM